MKIVSLSLCVYANLYDLFSQETFVRRTKTFFSMDLWLRSSLLWHNYNVILMAEWN